MCCVLHLGIVFHLELPRTGLLNNISVLGTAEGLYLVQIPLPLHCR